LADRLRTALVVGGQFVEPVIAAAYVGRLLDAVASGIPFAETEMVELVSFSAAGGGNLKHLPQLPHGAKCRW
jgi:hypothetical protein